MLVDFWAPWCGPCRTLSPVLEKIASEQSERFRLVKINSDENPELAQQFGVRGIPSVKLVYQAQLIGEFTGAQSESEVRKFLDEHLPAIDGLDEDVKSELGEKSLLEVETLLKQGELENALEMSLDLYSADSEDEANRYMLSRLLVFSKPDEALKLCDSLEGNASIDTFGLEQLKHLAYYLSDPEEKAYPDGPAKEKYLEAKSALSSGELSKSIELYLEVILTDRYYDEDASRKVIVSIFTALGPENPITLSYRKDFDRSLY